MLAEGCCLQVRWDRARGGRTKVVFIGAPREYLEEGEVGCLLGGRPQGLNLGGLQELGENVGVWGRGRLDDEVGGGAGRGGGFGEGEVRFQGVEGALLFHVSCR